MQRFFVFLLLILLGGVQSAEAKTCFLADILAGSDCLDIGTTELCNYQRIVPCGVGYNQLTCNRKGRTWYKCECNTSGNISTDVSVSGDTRYHCLETSFDTSCGCPQDKVVCNKHIFLYTASQQEEFTGATPIDACSDTVTGLQYRAFVCDEDKYPYECTQKGLQEDESSMCKASDGTRRYKSCSCANGWEAQECASRGDACTDMLDHVSGESFACYRCGPEACADRTKLNLATYWCNSFNVASKFNVDCSALGYQKMANSSCDNGTKAVSCPFDSTYKYCSN